MDLIFKPATTQKDIKSVVEYNIDAFSDSPDFNWNLEEVNLEISDGWELFSVSFSNEIIAAVFLKSEGDALLSKQTAIKMSHQGKEFSHRIKDFIEQKAKEKKLKKVVNHCRIDNFRMYSLNESHGYTKTNKKMDDSGQIVEWIKKLK